MDHPPAPEPPPAPAAYSLPASNVQPVAPPVPYQPYQPSAQPGYPPPSALYAYRLPKDRTTSILLAIFLGFVTWMYTYEKDAWKFWTAFAVTAVDVVLSAVTFGVWLFIAIPVGIGIWIWGIVDVTIRTRQFYDLYPAA